MAPYDADTYRRARAAGTPAKYALQLARWIVADRLDIDIDRPLTIERDGFTVTLKATSDSYIDLEDLGYGRFEDGTEDDEGYEHPDTPGAIPNPNRDSRNIGGDSRYYVPSIPRADRITEYRRAGMSRSVALDAARADETAELDRLSSWGPMVVVLAATVYRAGIELGSASVGGIELAWSDITRTDGSEYLAEVADDIIPEAIDEAKEALERLAVA